MHHRGTKLDGYNTLGNYINSFPFQREGKGKMVITKRTKNEKYTNSIHAGTRSSKTDQSFKQVLMFHDINSDQRR